MGGYETEARSGDKGTVLSGPRRCGPSRSLSLPSSNGDPEPLASMSPSLCGCSVFAVGGVVQSQSEEQFASDFPGISHFHFLQVILSWEKTLVVNIRVLSGSSTYNLGLGQIPFMNRNRIYTFHLQKGQTIPPSDFS